MNRLRAPSFLLVAVLGQFLAACKDTPPQDPDLAFHRGNNALALGRYDWARHFFQEDLRANPDRAESLRGLGLGWISGYEGSLSHGVEAFTAYLDKAPGDLEIRLRLASSWLRLGETQSVLEVLADAGDSAEVEQLRASALADTDPVTAERHALAALAAEPEHVAALLVAARLADRRGDTDTALAQASAAAAADPLRTETHYLLARIRRALEDDEGARGDLEIYEQLRRLPVRGRPSQLSDFEELQALRDLEPRLESSALPLRRRLARLMLATGDPGAETAIAELIADPDVEAFALLELAGEAHTRAKVDLARDLYRRALELDSDLHAARAQLARLEHETGDRDTARRLLTEGLDVDPWYASYHFVSGLVNLAEGSEPEAVESFETALDLAPWLASYRLALADVYLAAGRDEDLATLIDNAPGDDPAINAYRKRHLGR